MSGLKKYLIFCGLLLVAYVTAQYFEPKPTNWTPTYLAEDKIPYGTYILRQRITDIFPNVNITTVDDDVNDNLKEKPIGKSNYFVIASNLKVDSVDYNEMVKYMRAGNNIFIAAFEISKVLEDSLKLKITSNLRLGVGRKRPINFVNPTLRRDLDYYFERGISDQFFSKFDLESAVVLGKRENANANFLKYQFGKGALYITPNPQLFTNYSLLKEQGLDYAAKALSYLPSYQNLIWDEHFARPAEKDESILRVLFRYDPLRWAYYLALFGLVVFILFEMKRRQRIIPVIEPLKNSSVEFTQTVGRVYYQQRNNTDIAQKKISFFLEYIRSKYRLRTVVLDEEFKQSLVKITGATEDTINELMEMILFLQQKEKVNDSQLIRFNQVLEKFYKQDLR